MGGFPSLSKGVQGVASLPELRLMSKVLDLSDFRRRRHTVRLPSVFYLSEQGHCTDLLKSLEFLQVFDIRAMSQLDSVCHLHCPDLVLLESKLSWACTIERAKSLHDQFRIPIVLLCHTPKAPGIKRLIKKAYAAGVCDTLFTPLCREELLEVLGVLLKYQGQQSLYH